MAQQTTGFNMNAPIFSFQLFGFPVYVELSFFLMTLILGSQRSQIGLLLIWVAVVFVSILAHELGHALMGRRYGFAPRITLYSGGGLTSWEAPVWATDSLFRPKRAAISSRAQILISLAGPCAGFALGGLVWLGLQVTSFTMLPWFTRVMLADLLWVNIGWGILNLLPMLPLDGGQVMQELARMFWRSRAEQLAYQISIGVGVILCGFALLVHMYWGAMLCAWFTYTNYQALQGHRTAARDL